MNIHRKEGATHTKVLRQVFAEVSGVDIPATVFLR